MSIKAPQIAFTYWSGNSLTYLHILTLRTITKLNPNFKVIVYTDTKNQSTDYIPYGSHEHKVEVQKKLPFSVLYSLPNIEIIEVDFYRSYRVTETLFHSYLADIVRIKKLEEHGGVWFDMDILFLNPIADDLLTFPQNKSVKTISYADTIATGFTIALPNSEILKELSRYVDEYLEAKSQKNFEGTTDYKEHYQAFGPDLWRKVFHPHLDQRLKNHPNACALPVESLYPYLWNQMGAYFSGTGRTRVQHNKTLGVHWYNGSTEARTFINVTLPMIDLEAKPTTPVEIDLHRLKALGVDLSIPKISEYTTQLRGCNLQGVNFQNANLENADLRDANLQNANLQNANLKRADLRGANLNNANMSGANLTNAILEGLIPTDAIVEKQHMNVKTALGISVVIAAYNRKAQLLVTLKSLSESAHPNFEVIIVDDASDEDQAVKDFIIPSEYDFDVKVITVSEQEKTWVNPSVAYNIGIRYATKEVILLQNAEVMHVGDVLTFTAENIQPRDWLTFNCYGLNEKTTDAVYKGQKLMFDDVLKLNQRIGGNSVARDDVDGWLNHFERHFVAYHYCGAIFREDLMRDLDGGFSKDFENLIGGDDDHFVKHLIHLKYNFKISAFSSSSPFTIHLHHKKSENVKNWSKAKHAAAKVVLFRSLLKWGFAPEIDIDLAPKTEIPMARRLLV